MSKIFCYKEYPASVEEFSKLTPEERKAEIKRLEEESKNMAEWPKVE